MIDYSALVTPDSFNYESGVTTLLFALLKIKTLRFCVCFYKKIKKNEETLLVTWCYLMFFSYICPRETLIGIQNHAE